MNQRGQSSYAGTGYGIDRWISWATGYTVTIEGGSVTCAMATGDTYGACSQLLESFLATFLSGKMVTVSAMLEDGSVVSATGAFPGTGGTSLDYDFPDNVGHIGIWKGTAGDASFQIYLYAGKSVSLKAIKQELGSVSTLANDAPANFGEQFARCQRYFVRYSGNTNELIGVGIAYVTNHFYFPIYLPVNMRITPTVTFSGGFNLFGGADVIFDHISEIAGNAAALVMSDSTSSLSASTAYYIQFSSDGSHIDFSAIFKKHKRCRPVPGGISACRKSPAKAGLFRCKDVK